MRLTNMKATSVFLVIAGLLAPAAPVRAQAEVLQVIPDDAIGFVLVNRIGQSNDKLSALAKRLKIEMPASLLDIAKGELGAQKGLAEQASGAFAAFPGKGENDEPRGLMIAPVTNYQTFVDQFSPTETKDGISTFKVKNNNEVVVGKRGNFAIMTQARDRDLLARALKSSKSLSTWAAPLNDWLAANDVAGVLTSDGVKLLGSHMRKGLGDAKQGLANLPPEAQSIGMVLDGLENFIKSAESNVSHAGIAARVDAAGNLHISKRAEFLPGSGFAKAGAAVKASPGGPLAGLPSGSFVMALGGALPENAMQRMSKFSVEMLKANGQNIPDETLKKLDQVYEKMMKGMQGMSFVWQVGKENSPLFSNMVAVVQATDANAYLVEYEKGMIATNELMKGLNLPLVPSYEIKKVKVDGKQVLVMSTEIPGAAGMPEEVQKIFKGMFGADGKMTISAAVRDSKTVVMRYSGPDSLKEVLSAQGSGLAGDAGIIEVTKALPKGSQWAFYLSPKGLTDFADRAVKAFVPIPINVPPFPAKPPVAVGIRISGQSFELNAVIPAGVLDGAGEFGEKLKNLFGGGA